MAYCKNCGAQIHDQAVICPQCGVEQRPMGSANDTGNIGWGLLGCCVPIAGLILWLMWKDTQPKNAKSAGIGALINVIVSVVFYVIYFVAMGVLMADGGFYY